MMKWLRWWNFHEWNYRYFVLLLTLRMTNSQTCINYIQIRINWWQNNWHTVCVHECVCVMCIYIRRFTLSQFLMSQMMKSFCLYYYILRCSNRLVEVSFRENWRQQEQRPREQCQNSSCYQTINREQTIDEQMNKSECEGDGDGNDDGGVSDGGVKIINWRLPRI